MTDVAHDPAGSPDIPETESVPSSIQSSMDALRQRHTEIRDRQWKDIEVPGYEDLIVCRYRPLKVQGELELIGQRVQREQKGNGAQTLYASIDTMLMACVELFLMVEDKMVPMSEAIPGNPEPVRYADPRFIAFMGWNPEEVNSGRRAILELFGGARWIYFDDPGFSEVSLDDDFLFEGGLRFHF